MDNYNSGKLLQDAETIGSIMFESENKFIKAIGERLVKMSVSQDVEGILRFKEGVEHSMPGIWDEYWEV